MPSTRKSIILCLALLLVERVAPAAGALDPQIAPLPSPDASSTQKAIRLPEFSVRASRSFAKPYSDRGYLRANSYSKSGSEHYGPLPCYDANAALHLYTRRLAPRVSSKSTVMVEHYQVPPDYDSNIAMHPYTSGFGPCAQGHGKTVCTEAIPRSHYNQSRP